MGADAAMLARGGGRGAGAVTDCGRKGALRQREDAEGSDASKTSTCTPVLV